MASSTDWKLANDFVDCMRCPKFEAVVEVVDMVEVVEEVEVVVVWEVVPVVVWSQSSSSSQSTSTAVMFKPDNSSSMEDWDVVDVVKEAMAIQIWSGPAGR